MCSSFRNLTDRQIDAIIEKNGYIGVNFYPHFLKDGGENTTIDDVIRHIDYIADRGGIQNIGLGSDYDGIEVQPKGLENASCMKNLIDALLKHGYSEENTRAIMGMNLWNLLKKGDAVRK